MTTFEIYTDTASEYRFRLKAANGLNILASEGYTSKSACLNGIESVKTNSQVDSMYAKNKSSNQKHYFNLKAANDQIIGTSQMYESLGGMLSGIASVKKNAPIATIEEV
ncbi:YegP family protein [Psychroflexus salinarum]|uniref:YegP family protein n=1 Tax=Psychroflexus salinarum TaxID=546024 RepID=A0ABW3GQI0_9FLAO